MLFRVVSTIEFRDKSIQSTKQDYRFISMTIVVNIQSYHKKGTYTIIDKSIKEVCGSRTKLISPIH